MNISKALGFAIVGGLCMKAGAQSSPSFGVDLRSFGNDERLTYLGVFASESFQNQFKLQVAGNFSNTSIFKNSAGIIRHGGTDVEFLGTYTPPKCPVDLSLGLGLPNTADRGIVPALTYRAAYKFLNCDKCSLSLDSYGVAESSPLLIVGLTGTYRMDKTRFKVSVGAPFDGNNSVSINYNSRNRVGLFSVGADWTYTNNVFGLAITNQLGWTTGMMATPALGGYPGIEASWKVTF
jgi:hypothetical protein